MNDAERNTEFVDSFVKNAIIIGDVSIPQMADYFETFPRRLEDELNTRGYNRERFDLSVSAISMILQLRMDEYEKDPVGVRRELGIPTNTIAPMQTRRDYAISDIVVQTVVRATVWEGVKSIFRAFR